MLVELSGTGEQIRVAVADGAGGTRSAIASRVTVEAALRLLAELGSAGRRDLGTLEQQKLKPVVRSRVGSGQFVRQDCVNGGAMDSEEETGERHSGTTRVAGIVLDNEVGGERLPATEG
jgi:hypothetical protein